MPCPFSVQVIMTLLSFLFLYYVWIVREWSDFLLPSSVLNWVILHFECNRLVQNWNFGSLIPTIIIDTGRISEGRKRGSFFSHVIYHKQFFYSFFLDHILFIQSFFFLCLTFATLHCLCCFVLYFLKMLWVC